MRVAVCYGIARGLYHLHQQTNPYIIHRNIKSSNILLDSNLTPKITSFYYVKFDYEPPIEEDDYVVIGTIGYLDPEYLKTGKCTLKSDLYGFGVVMLEIMSGRKAMERNSNGGYIHLGKWALDLLANDRVLEVVDPVLADFPIDQVLGFMDVAFSCIQDESRLRPSMGEVIQMLNGSPRTTFETQPNTPYLSAASSFRSSSEGVIEGESSIVEGESSEECTQTEIEEAAETSVAHSSAIKITQQQGMGITVSGSGDLVERLSQTMVFERSSVRQGEFAAYTRKKNMMPRNKA